MSFEQIRIIAANFLKKHEGFRPEVYKDIAGVRTIGYGFTGLTLVQKQIISEIEADQELFRIIGELFDKLVADLSARRVAKMSNSRVAAIVSFVYNIGFGAYKRSTFRRLLLADKYDEAAEQLPRWNKVSGKVSKGLTNRRNAEYHLFFCEE